jgi:putative DNA primase/helicase
LTPHTPRNLEEANKIIEDQQKTIRLFTKRQLKHEADKIQETKPVKVLINPVEMMQDEKLIIPRIADEILGQLGDGFLITPISETGGDIVWRYVSEEGIYRPNGVPWIEELVEKQFGELVTSGMMREVVKLIQVKTYDFKDEFREEKYPNMLVVENGVLDIHTRELKPYSKDYMAKQRLPVKYDPEAHCPNFAKFIVEVAENADAIAMLQEWTGYHLLKDYRFQKSLMLVGAGANGKGTLLNVWNRLLGPENVSHVSMYNLSASRFATSQLYGKLANIAPDLSSDELKRTGTFKNLTGGEKVYAEKKFQQGFSYWNYAKLSWSANQLPITPDLTPAFFRRWLFAKFLKTFEGVDANKNLLEELTTPEELSGILNWALDGLDRLLENQDFTDTASAMEIQDMYEEMMDPVTAFIKNCVTEDPDVEVEKDKFYQAYRYYCRSKGRVAVAKNLLTQELKARLTEIGETRPKPEGWKKGDKRPWKWKGIQLKCETCDLGHTGHAGQGCYTLSLSREEVSGKKLNTNTPDLRDLFDPDEESNTRKCSSCGIPLNNDTGILMDRDGKWYCRQHLVSE